MYRCKLAILRSSILFRLISGRLLSAWILFGLLFFSSMANAYDLKTYFGIGLGVGELDHTVEGTTRGSTSDEIYRITFGLDLTDRLSLELRWTNYGEYEYRAEESVLFQSESANPVGFSITGLFYIFGSRGLEGISQRRGLNGFIDLGVTRINDVVFLGTTIAKLQGNYANAGLGLEYGFSNSVFMRGQINAVGKKLLIGKILVGWRWGRQR